MNHHEFDERHRARYAKVMRREMTLASALEENDEDWTQLREALELLADLAALPAGDSSCDASEGLSVDDRPLSDAPEGGEG